MKQRGTQSSARALHSVARWMNHSRATASSSEVASRQDSDAHAAEAQCDCASTGCFGASAVEVTGSPEEIPSRGPRSCINEDPSKAVIASLGADDIEERSSLEAAFFPPVDKRIEDTSVFIARAKKHIAAESLKIEQAEKQRQVFEEELAQAERDLECFQREAETWKPITSPRGVGTVEGWCGSRCTVCSKRETAMSHRRGARRYSSHANLVLAELNMWLEERHADLRDALMETAIEPSS